MFILRSNTIFIVLLKYLRANYGANYVVEALIAWTKNIIHLILKKLRELETYFLVFLTSALLEHGGQDMR